MKRNTIYVLLSSIFYSLLLVTSCKEDDPSATETNLKRLAAHNWKLTKVSVDGVDKTALFTGLALQWNKNQTFGATNGGVMWPSSGTWSFNDNSGKMLVVSLNKIGDADVKIETLNEAMLVISLRWDMTIFSEGRTRSVEGDHVFEFEAAD